MKQHLFDIPQSLVHEVSNDLLMGNGNRQAEAYHIPVCQDPGRYIVRSQFKEPFMRQANPIPMKHEANLNLETSAPVASRIAAPIRISLITTCLCIEMLFSFLSLPCQISHLLSCSHQVEMANTRPVYQTSWLHTAGPADTEAVPARQGSTQ